MNWSKHIYRTIGKSSLTYKEILLTITKLFNLNLWTLTDKEMKLRIQAISVMLSYHYSRMTN